MELCWSWLLMISYQHAMPNGIICFKNAVRHDMSVKTYNPQRVFELRRSDIFNNILNSLS